MEHTQCITVLATPLTFGSNINELQASLHLVLVDIGASLTMDEEDDPGQSSLKVDLGRASTTRELLVFWMTERRRGSHRQ